jgi:hypothetical protein
VRLLEYAKPPLAFAIPPPRQSAEHSMRAPNYPFPPRFELAIMLFHPFAPLPQKGPIKAALRALIGASVVVTAAPFYCELRQESNLLLMVSTIMGSTIKNALAVNGWRLC